MKREFHVRFCERPKGRFLWPTRPHQLVRNALGDNPMIMKANSAMDTIESILWQSFLLPGHEACRLFSQDLRWYLEGTAVFFHEKRPCRLDYQVICDNAWRTLSAKVDGWIGNTIVGIQIKTDSAQYWWLNGIEQPSLRDCIDVDLNFSPSTNLIPIRRMDLAIGEKAGVKAAWLRFPSFRLELLSQQYLRLDETTYRYESADGQFVADLKVNRSGFVIEYPGIWRSEVSSEGELLS
jgi:hypothetical protein